MSKNIPHAILPYCYFCCISIVHLLRQIAPGPGFHGSPDEGPVSLERPDIARHELRATALATDGVRRIVRAFADPTVGCVSSVDQAVDGTGRPSGEGLYVKYEMLLRRLETKAGSVVGLSGSCFAVRRDVCREWATDVPSDFNTVLCAVRLGLRGVVDGDSVGSYKTLTDGSK